jgi:hypothetical protein
MPRRLKGGENEIENENVPPPPPPNPSAANIAKVNASANQPAANVAKVNVPTANAPKVNAPKAPNVPTKTVSAYVPQMREGSVSFRHFTVETKIIDETGSITI